MTLRDCWICSQVPLAVGLFFAVYWLLLPVCPEPVDFHGMDVTPPSLEPWPHPCRRPIGGRGCAGASRDRHSLERAPRVAGITPSLTKESR